MYFVDTNIFLRALISSTNRKVDKECLQFVKTVQEEGIKCTISNIIFAELAWTLKSFYNFTKPEIVMSLQSIENLRFQITDKFQNSLALQIYENKNVKFVDALIASIPELYNKKWTIVSYDKDFDKIGIKRIEPSELKTN